MAQRSRVTCRRCKGHRDDRRPDGSKVGPISYDGNCRQCGKEAMDTNVDQMHDRRGHNWDLWRAGMIRAAGGLVPDQLLAREARRG